MNRPPRHILPRHILPLLLPVIMPMLAFGPARGVAPRHPSHPATMGGPVTLTQQPDSVLDRAARLLNAGDLAAAARRGNTPVVLVGSAPLSTRAGDSALFVQLQSADLCGSAGCSTSVYLRKDKQDWIKVLDSVSGPVSLSHRTHGGMHDLIINGTDRWVWNGTTYRDTMPAPPADDLRQSIERYQAQHHKAPPPQ
ncbi:hypothetical protein [Gluconacetobacter diazotrophicus]|uniref:hypothetical protein n=1 Tax=Gluconacetobacter diazotrophicus TaxID=33996 RepID=UPI00119A1AF9|nr:hypothetical protein [Gluconacetobacter diazotrophicus]TWB08527.1 hypothetical protein FBZ86_10624 [Gluconacetobacter diazotrophicus]